MRAQPKPAACSTEARGQAGPTLGVDHDPGDGGGLVGGVVAVDEDAGRRATAVRQAADVGRDDGGAAGLRLDRNEPERLVVRRARSPSAARYAVGERRCGRPAGRSATRSAMPQFAGELARAHGLRRARCRWAAADDGDDESVAQVGDVASSSSGRSHQHVGRLERLDASDEQQQDGCRADSPRRSGGGASPGRKTSRSTPGATTRTRLGSASYRSTSSAASASVLATSRSAASTTWLPRR